MQNIFHSTELFRTEHIYLLNAYTIKALLESCIRLNTSFGLNAQWHLTRKRHCNLHYKSCRWPEDLEQNSLCKASPQHTFFQWCSVFVGEKYRQNSWENICSRRASPEGHWRWGIFLKILLHIIIIIDHYLTDPGKVVYQVFLSLC